QVWIKDGRVLMMPKWKYATREVITAVLDGRAPKVVNNVQDRVLDGRIPLINHVDTHVRILDRNDYSMIFGYLPEYRLRNLQFIQKEDTTVLLCSGLSLKNLLYQAYRNRIFSGLGPTIGAGIHWEVGSDLKKQWLSVPKVEGATIFEQDSL